MLRVKTSIEISEAEHQKNLFTWARHPATLKKYPELALMFCTGNGIRLTFGAAKKFKNQGNLSGVPDVILLVPRKGKYGLLIEMKKIKGVVSDSQEKFIGAMNDNGYLAVVAYGFESAKKTIEEYLQ